jgi:F5/8 type C domain/Cellulase (glycosyl hydrolase family 5)
LAVSKRRAPRADSVIRSMVAATLVLFSFVFPVSRAVAGTPGHRLGVRVIDGIGEFFDRRTGLEFVPRGNNFIRLGPQQRWSGESIVYHDTFNIGQYDALDAESELAEMEAEGYNVVRVFLDGECLRSCLGNPTTGEFRTQYLLNLIDFLERARAHGIFVIITTDFLAAGTKYQDLLFSADDPQVGDTNIDFLTTEGLRAYLRFWRDLVSRLIEMHVPRKAIFAFELRNETSYVNEKPPFALTSGSFTAPNGQTYDLSSEQAKIALREDGIVYWIDRIRKAILRVDPTALVTIGFVDPVAAAAADRSSADFMDLHPYPGLDYTLEDFTTRFQLSGRGPKPVLMGEFGAFRHAFPTASAAARALQDWQADSCARGFLGWLLWTWDTEKQPDGELWNGHSDGEVIEESLAPVNRPDPCAPGTLPGNIAMGKTATASQSLSTNPPSMALDGLSETWWSAGDFPAQWIEIDLGVPRDVAMIALLTSQFPQGETATRVLGKATPDAAYQLLHEFSGFTTDRQWLRHAPATPWTGIRFLRVEMTDSPSWVAWREVQVFAPDTSRQDT